MSDKFKELLAAIESAEANESALAKALPGTDEPDDEAIADAAAEADPDAEGADADADADEEGKEPMAKSLGAEDEGVEYVDAGELIKSLGDLTTRVGSFEEVLTKSLQSTLNTINAQGKMIKSLTEQVSKLSGQGAGRKTVLTVLEKPKAGDELAKSQGNGLTHEEFFMKANTLFDAKKITGSELNLISVSLREKQAIEPALVSKVMNTNV